MGAKSTISWTDATWSPLRARVRENAAAIARAKGYTSLVSIGDKMAGHVGHHCEHISPGCKLCYSGTIQARCLPVNGTGLPFDRRSRDLVEPFVDQNILWQPLHWKKPRKIFVESQSDLFGEWYTDEMIDEVFTLMVAADWHTYQVLTKRIDRAMEYFSSGRHDFYGPDRANYHLEQKIWLGVSAEDQPRADDRISALLAAPAEVHFLSLEPLIGAIHLRREWLKKIDWVIVGGESGAGARPCRIEWIEDLIEQCGAYKVPCFVKQLGAYPVWAESKAAPTNPARGKGDDPEQWPESLRVQEMPA